MDTNVAAPDEQVDSVADGVPVRDAVETMDDLVD